MRLTVSCHKADVGSIGGHTKPSSAMLELCQRKLEEAQGTGLILDGFVDHCGDDIRLTLSHTNGRDAEEVHMWSWDVFLAATKVAQEEGLYGAGQDLLVDAPSGNIRGAGPAVAEIEFDLHAKHRPAEALMLLAADKCSPGAYNKPIAQVFGDPMHNTGLLLKAAMFEGWVFTIIDMDAKVDRVIRLKVPEQWWDALVLLSNPDRFAISEIHSRAFPDEQVVDISATRLHNIAGSYTGKDDPIAIIRTQGIFPAPEEVQHPWMWSHFVTGDCRGSHVMPIMPVAINTPVAGAFCLPIVSAAAVSINAQGIFSEVVDVFGDVSWDETRRQAQKLAAQWRTQGVFGPTLASQAELAYTGMVERLAALNEHFEEAPTTKAE